MNHKHPRPNPQSVLLFACSRCRAAKGEWCKNYKGQRKTLCKERGKPKPPPPKKNNQPTLF